MIKSDNYTINQKQNFIKEVRNIVNKSKQEEPKYEFLEKHRKIMSRYNPFGKVKRFNRLKTLQKHLKQLKSI
jgi:hypothetical protein